MTRIRQAPWLAHFSRHTLLILRALKAPILRYFVIAGNVVTLTCATAFWSVEHATNPHVRSYFDAIWWAFATVTTVGYGDVTPVTVAGRLIAMVLMVTGISLFVGFTALLVGTIDALGASEMSAAATDKLLQQMRVDMKTLHDDLKQLRSVVDELAKRP